MKKWLASTLAEVLIAVAVLTTGVLALLGIYPLGLHAVRDAGDLAAATQLATRLMEEERSKPFLEIVSRGPSSVDLPTMRHGQAGHLPLDHQVLVTDLTGAVPAKDVLVQVSWQSSSGLKTIRLETEVIEP